MKKNNHYPPEYLVKYIQSYQIDVRLSKEENLERYKKVRFRPFYKYWYNQPWVDYFEAIADCHAEFDTLESWDRVGTLVGGIIITGLSLLYLPIYFLFLLSFGVGHQVIKNKKVQLAKAVLDDFYNTYGVQLEYGIFDTQKALNDNRERRTKIQKDSTAYNREIANNQTDNIWKKYGQTILKNRTVLKKYIRFYDDVISLQDEYLKELGILRANHQLNMHLISYQKDNIIASDLMTKHDQLLDWLNALKKNTVSLRTHSRV